MRGPAFDLADTSMGCKSRSWCLGIQEDTWPSCQNVPSEGCSYEKGIFQLFRISGMIFKEMVVQPALKCTVS